ncbi:hypothetical protein GCM10009660_35350 [Catellatospora bangladeshensis]
MKKCSTRRSYRPDRARAGPPWSTPPNARNPGARRAPGFRAGGAGSTPCAPAVRQATATDTGCTPGPSADTDAWPLPDRCSARIVHVPGAA